MGRTFIFGCDLNRLRVHALESRIAIAECGKRRSVFLLSAAFRDIARLVTLGETIGGTFWIGAALIVSGVVLVMKEK